jgi:hypothetical protein
MMTISLTNPLGGFHKYMVSLKKYNRKLTIGTGILPHKSEYEFREMVMIPI